MTVTAIQIGLHPDVVDFESADFSQFKGLSKEGLTKANSDNIAGLRAAGYEVDNCLIATGAAGVEKARPGCRPSGTTRCSSALACAWWRATPCCSRRS